MLEDRRSRNVVSIEEGDPLRTVQQILESAATDETRYRFVGGAVGYVSYDAARFWEKKLNSPRDAGKACSQFPDINLGFYEEGLLYDHRTNRAHYFFSDRIRERTDEIKNICDKDDSPSPKRPPVFSTPATNVTKEEFEESVRRAKKYIHAGEIFQVVLSKRYEFKAEGDLLQFYANLRILNPSPYMYFLDMGETKIIGSSPEMLVRVEGRAVETFPIAGTRPAAQIEVQNAKLRKDLLSDPKERAEHIMLVDLARNDIGKVSAFGSVSVPKFMDVHQFSHVQHIVSQVRGRLKKEMNCFDAFRAVFPAGTVSGAPKIRAMEIIDELEAEKRGPYAGAVGYFSYNGNMDSAITIRTLLANKNNASIQTGAGIVADSDPEAEWKETELKTAVLLKALQLSVVTDESELVDTV